jgi:hypothetical protein
MQRAATGFARSAILAIALSATGCVQGIRDVATCRDQAGPEPGTAWLALGGFGALGMAQQPDHQAWQARYHECWQQLHAVASR